MRFAILLTLCLIGVASAHSLNKRSLNGEVLRQHAMEIKANLDKLRESLMNRFQNKPDVSAEVTVAKRDLQEVFEKLNKYAQSKTQEAMNNLRRIIDSMFNKNPFNNDDEDTTEHPLAKRGIFDALEKMNTKAQESAKKIFDSLQRTIAAIFSPFKPRPVQVTSEDSTEKSVAKRDIFDHFQRMNEKVKAQAQKAFDQLRKVFDELFKKYPDAHGIEVEIQDGEVVTERIIKRNIFDFFGRLNEQAQEEAAKIFAQLEKNFGNIFKHNDEDEEIFDLEFDDDSTEVSIEKRDIFNWLGGMNERFQDQSARFFNQIHKPGQMPGPNPFMPHMPRPHMPMPHMPHMPMPMPHMPMPHMPMPWMKPAPKPAPKPEDEVEEIEVVTVA